MRGRKIALIDYGSGNLRSAQKALAYVAQDLDGDCEVTLTDKAEEVAAADAVVLPGVGAFGACAAGLRGIDGMVAALEEAVLEKARPFLGICVGMQLMASTGEEGAKHDGLGWLGGAVTALRPEKQPEKQRLKIPHMGWNELHDCAAHPVLDGLEGEAVYFVHSFVLRPEVAAHQLARCDYGGAFAAVVGRDNMVGTQFHPEKSQQVGLRLIKNFLEWRA